jgi:hypothetical protein
MNSNMAVLTLHRAKVDHLYHTLLKENITLCVQDFVNSSSECLVVLISLFQQLMRSDLMFYISSSEFVLLFKMYLVKEFKFLFHVKVKGLGEQSL